MCVTICGRFDPNEGGVVGYVDRMRAKSPAKWGVYLAGMNFQTCSRLDQSLFENIYEEDRKVIENTKPAGYGKSYPAGNA